MNNWENRVFQETGHNSFNDMIQNAFHVKLHLSTIHLFAITFGGVLAFLESVTESWIYSPALGVGILFVCTVADSILGIAVAISKQKGIQTSRLSRAFVRFVIQILFVGIFFNMSKTFDAFVQMWMVDFLLIIFTLTTFYSAIENAHTLGYITTDQFKFIQSVVNIKNLVDKFTKKSK